MNRIQLLRIHQRLTDEGTKSVMTLGHLLQDLGAADGFDPTPLWNDNRLQLFH